MKNQKGFGVIEIIIASVVVIVIGVIGWRVWQSQSPVDNQSRTEAVSSSVQSPSSSPENPEDTPVKSPLNKFADNVIQSVASVVTGESTAQDNEKQLTAATSDGRASGWFQKCSQTKNWAFDPIVHFKKEPPVGHRHVFGGATAIAYDSIRSDLIKGGTTCQFGNGDNGGNKSSYWVPDLRLRDKTWSGAAQFNVYYKAGDVANLQDIKPYPRGLKMVIHDDETSNTRANWFCSDTDGAADNGIHRKAPYDCNPKGKYPRVTGTISFPQCGDGRINSRDHISHVKFLKDNGRCPASHPYLFTGLKVTVKYNTWKGKGAMLADGMNPSTQFHADYFEAWEDGAFEALLAKCHHAGENCRNRPDLR